LAALSQSEEAVPDHVKLLASKWMPLTSRQNAVNTGSRVKEVIVMVQKCRMHSYALKRNRQQVTDTVR
jgi:hypothetical protein